MSYLENFHFSDLLAASELDIQNLKNESFPNKTAYTLFWLVESSDFKNVIQNKIHWADFEAAEV